MTYNGWQWREENKWHAIYNISLCNKYLPWHLILETLKKVLSYKNFATTLWSSVVSAKPAVVVGSYSARAFNDATGKQECAKCLHYRQRRDLLP